LSADGEEVKLFDNQNNLIDAVDFGTSLPWTPDACGTGKTLELMHPSLNNSLPESWHAITMGGTPGAANSPGTTSAQVPELQLAGGLECFPNPFRDFTTIRFDVVAEGDFKLEIFDLQGRLVKVLHDGILVPDSYWIDWNGEGSDQGGVYTVRLSGNAGIRIMKVVKL